MGRVVLLIWGELSKGEFSFGRVVLGRVVFGASCPYFGQNDSRAKRPGTDFSC